MATETFGKAFKERNIYIFKICLRIDIVIDFFFYKCNDLTLEKIMEQQMQNLLTTSEENEEDFKYLFYDGERTVLFHEYWIMDLDALKYSGYPVFQIGVKSLILWFSEKSLLILPYGM